MIIFVSLLIALIGVLMYALAVNPKPQIIGIVSYGAGILAFLLRFSAESVNFLR